MKLERVVFRHVVTLPSGRKVNEVTRAGFPEAQFDYDRAHGTISLGKKRIPLASVVEFDLADSEEVPCPECEDAGIDATFEDARALGAHRSKKHDVRGTSRKQETTR